MLINRSIQLLSGLRRRLKFKILCLISILALVGCEQAKEDSVLRMGTISWAAYEALYLAEELKLYPSNKIHMVEAPISSSLIQALRGNTTHGGAMTLARAMNFVEEGTPLTIVAVLAYSNGIDQIYAKPEIKSIKDLRGKHVAVETGTVNEYVLARALEMHNMSMDEVIITHDPDLNPPSIFAGTEFDAISFFSLPSEADPNDGHTLFSSADLPGEIMDVLVVRTDFLENNPSTVQALLEGWLQAKYIQETTSNLNSLPEGVMDHEDYKRQMKYLRPAIIEDNLRLLFDNGAELKALMTRKRDVTTYFRPHQSDAPYPSVDDRLFKAALESVRRQTDMYAQ